MVRGEDVGRVVLDAARLVKEGEIVVFGSAALAFWMDDAPSTRDVDLWCVPEDRGEIVEAVMGEESWYDEKHHAYVEVWAPETFAAPSSWRSRARTLHEDSAPGVTLVVPHPTDIVLAKLERWESQDVAHARLVLARWPLTVDEIRRRTSEMPYETGRVSEPARVAAFRGHLEQLLAMVAAR